MPLHAPRFLPALILVAAVVLTPGSPGVAQVKDKPLDPEHAAKMAKGAELFKTTVRGILQAKCVKCHTGERVEGEFDMTTRESLLKGGASGPAVVPGDHNKSLLYQLVSHQKQPHMPHERPKLPDAEIARIAEWIDLGAPYDRPLVGKDDASAWTQKVLPADAKKHWAFQPLTNPTPPFGREPKASTHPIDAFVSAKLGEHSFVLNPLADKRTLIRRVYLDLIGLPPTLEEVDAFLK
ncbi:MAG TPA: DUF1549 domain-containing protein, partial [Gemmataceae bacterium]|nr:DUF1549 domain-containing protein [Gemmataceae bacterium]